VEKRYLGDGVYVDLWEAGGLVLTTENGMCATNTVLLEDLVIRSLERYINDCREEGRAQRAVQLREDGKGGREGDGGYGAEG